MFLESSSVTFIEKLLFIDVLTLIFPYKTSMNSISAGATLAMLTHQEAFDKAMAEADKIGLEKT